MEPLMLILAAMGGWTLDDFCGTPPRPMPWPGPGPWWIRKGLAVIGGVAAYIVFAEAIGGPDVLSTVVVGGAGGVVLASLGSAFGLGGVRGADVRTGTQQPG